VGADEDAVTALVAARSAALVAGDAEAMAQILADDFTYTNASGDTCDRADYLAGYVTSPDLVWQSQDSTAPEVRVYGDAAVVTLDVSDRATWRGEPFAGEFRSLYVYVRRDRVWRCVAGQTTARSAD
jgi:uncharacterized protein (TIGR02246 family)